LQVSSKGSGLRKKKKINETAQNEKEGKDI